MTDVRDEVTTDHPAVHQILCDAFDGEIEASLVRPLRGVSGSISLVAVETHGVVGHILFSAAQVAGRPVPLAALGPMAVSSSRRRRGIGSALVRRGIDTCRCAGYAAIVVVGHAEYYPRFGFRPASGFGLRCQFKVPDEAFMALELQHGILAGGGEVRFAAPFSEE